MGFLLNWLGKVLAKTRVYKKEHRWAWEMIQEVWSSRESLLYLQLMATVKRSAIQCVIQITVVAPKPGLQ